MIVVKIKFEEDTSGALHQHHHIQATYVESGHFEVTNENEITIINTGDGFYIPPNATHGVVCLQAGVLIDSFTHERKNILTQ